MVEFMILACFLLILGFGGFIADYIFPHIKPLNDFIENLPMMDDYEEDDNDILRKENIA